MVLGSGIRDPEKTHSGSRIQGSKRHRSRIRIRNTGIQPKMLDPGPYQMNTDSKPQNPASMGRTDNTLHKNLSNNYRCCL
jgi:hypothetical protein